MANSGLMTPRPARIAKEHEFRNLGEIALHSYAFCPAVLLTLPGKALRSIFGTNIGFSRT
jgi:hypothetical protein